MMTSISGELGAGKTYVLARECYNQAKAGCYVATNFRHMYANKIIPNNAEELLEFIRQVAVLKQRGGELCDILPSFRHTGLFLAIDEAHLVFGRESPKADMEKVILPFISLARKQDVQIWYTVQDYATIHKTFRRYTKTSFHIRPLLPLFKVKNTPHETRPTLRRERRLWIPYVWEERHKLDADNPTLNYRRRKIEGAGWEYTEDSTLQSRRIRRNNDPFIHSMFDSNELSGVNIDPDIEETFSLIRDADYIPMTYHKDRFPTFRKVAKFFHIPVTEIKVPPRVKITGWEMPEPPKAIRHVPRLQQTPETMSAEDLIRKTFPREFKNLKREEARLDRRRAEHRAKDTRNEAPPAEGFKSSPLSSHA